jgi:hypothetical protein
MTKSPLKVLTYSADALTRCILEVYGLNLKSETDDFENVVISQNTVLNHLDNTFNTLRPLLSLRLLLYVM